MLTGSADTDSTAAPSRVLVVRLGALGDVVRTLPSVRAIRRAWPDAHLAWLVEPKASGVVASQPWIDETIVFPRGVLTDLWSAGRPFALMRDALEFCADLRRRKFDCVLDFHGILKSGVLTRVTGAPRRLGYARGTAREVSWLFVNRRQVLPSAPVSRFDRNAALAGLAGIQVGVGCEADPPPLEVDPGARAAMERRLSDGPRQDGARVVIHPGSSPATPYKRYPNEHWAAVARSLVADGFSVLVAAGASTQEQAAVEAIVRGASGVVAAPETSRFEDLAALLSLARVFIGADSGPLHVASLVGTPVVQILGPTHPVENQPYAQTPSRSVREPVACSPCRRGCAAASCMTGVPPEAVVAAVRSLWAEVSGGRHRE